MRDFEQRPRGDYDDHTPEQLVRELLAIGVEEGHRGRYIQASRDLLMACAVMLERQSKAAAFDAKRQSGAAEKAAAFDALASGLRQLIKAVQP